MELRQLKYFLKAKELLNFTEAANSLHISQSTLSQQIKQLEDELKIPLFNRIGKRITITEAGELFSIYALQSVNKSKEGLQLLKDLNDLETGKITIGVTYALRYVLTKSLVEFTSRFPKIKFEIVFGTSKELIHKLSHFELDFILTFEEIPSENHFKYQELFSSPMALVTSSKSVLKGKTSIGLAEISKLPLILPARGYSTTQFINDAFLKNKLDIDVTIEINDIPTLLELVKTGNWYTILTQTTVASEKDLFTIPITGKDMTRTAMIISLKEVYEKKAVSIFLSILKSLV
ncbi:LysR family transcriptional regulator [Flavobacterium aquidurense]|jgi:LysR family cyn operon transcriptional activator|uniref:LysR family transcriptional regulator n=1 Tax=Flavobacterium aquidurense TaxID=362413 RepID=UPI00091477C4|nr:LysR substrate-binding domain-containing protein [Flavobacterium aquidurense]OXA74342.1 LysR family transcriptional regulator [Flavobacterium aquidurense]SHF93330.1 LysR family transcriptional regulator, cyn operon transcriptional activator [Flavobacterium frigidimaris]